MQEPKGTASHSSSHTLRIGVLVNAVGGYSRGVLRGIASYASTKPWTLRVVGVNEKDIDERDTRWAGIIVQAATAQQARRFHSLYSSPKRRTPVVNISSSLADTQLPTVITDDVAVGRLGAEHFIRVGYRTLIFYGPDRRAFVRNRYDGFAARCTDSAIDVPFLAEPAELTHALRLLPKPLAVMGCNDRAALEVLDACRPLSLRVPDDVAVLGVDDDDLVQALAYPPLSSVNTARDRVGFEAAAMLDRLIQSLTANSSASSSPDPSRILVAPKGVVARRSTDATAIADQDVAEAARFIHANAARPISVDDVATAASISRRQLERRFRTALGRSILDEIVRQRVDRARQLLLDSQLTLEQIALASGFASASYFSVVFKRTTGSTPQKYRDAYRSAAG
jgi:LacI family transcriptional regulator